MSTIGRNIRKWMRRGESGQSIIVLAIAILALTTFVGIVTDVSLMFVRYNTLRRAVDSASVAAATQMRQGTDFATVSLAARQFIEFYGLSPLTVLVTTCDSIGVDANGDGQITDWELDVNGNPIVGTPSNDLRPEEVDPELCGGENFFAKQVRVTAQVLSPTVFLQLIGWDDFTLQASAVSTTALLDVVVILDVSESMLNETTVNEWAEIGYGQVYVPPEWQEIWNGRAAEDPVMANPFIWWQEELLKVPQAIVNKRLSFSDPANPDIDNQPGDDPLYEVGSFVPTSISTEYGADQAHPREACRVRFWPASRGFPLTNDMIGWYTEWNTLVNGTLEWSGAPQWQGFVPTYDFYGCCNDPTAGGYWDDDGNFQNPSDDPGGDYDFSDLICQPFKQARDATLQFIERLDFPRDRIAFVTFDQSAFIIDPYTRPDEGSGPIQLNDFMITSRADAQLTVKRHIGVRSEPNFYQWNVDTNPANQGHVDTSGWIGFAAGISADQTDCEDIICSNPVDFADEFPNEGDPEWFNYPVRYNCEFFNATLPLPYTRYPPTRFDAGGNQIAPGSFSSLDIHMLNSDGEGGLDDRFSYEVRAGCRGTNIGASLRESYRALNQNLRPRTSGAVWIVILLGDGAAAASDPVRRNTDPADVVRASQPYQITGSIDWYQSPGETTPANENTYGVAGDYGAFGVCPSNLGGTIDPRNVEDGDPTFMACKNGSGNCDGIGELIDTSGNEPSFPFCSDESPLTRHQCDFDAFREVNGRSADVLLESCDPLYDVDDYARDWADAVGLLKDGESIDQKPTIFTIGFGLTFDNDEGGTIDRENDWEGMCRVNLEDCLGEELLRYIADVGDNFRMDSDYWQDWVEADDPITRRIDGRLDESLNGFGLRGPCQAEGGTYRPLRREADFGNGLETTYDYIAVDGASGLEYVRILDMYMARPVTENCGNYYNAPNQDELELVFDEIASRMFTRLSR